MAAKTLVTSLVPVQPMFTESERRRGGGNPARFRHAGRVAGRNSHALSGLRAVDLNPGLPHIDGIALLK
jgi:hypothetical protein